MVFNELWKRTNHHKVAYATQKSGHIYLRRKPVVSKGNGGVTEQIMSVIAAIISYLIVTVLSNPLKPSVCLVERDSKPPGHHKAMKKILSIFCKITEFSMYEFFHSKMRFPGILIVSRLDHQYFSLDTPSQLLFPFA